jgi:hypothetical protein
VDGQNTAEVEDGKTKKGKINEMTMEVLSDFKTQCEDFTEGWDFKKVVRGSRLLTT